MIKDYPFTDFCAPFQIRRMILLKKNNQIKLHLLVVERQTMLRWSSPIMIMSHHPSFSHPNDVDDDDDGGDDDDDEEDGDDDDNDILYNFLIEYNKDFAYNPCHMNSTKFWNVLVS